jgi:hypothetical protein
MQKPKLTACLIAALVLSAAFPAEAYIGPGAGAGTITVVLGILSSIVMAFFAIIWYPVKRLFFKKKSSAARAKVGDSRGADRT